MSSPVYPQEFISTNVMSSPVKEFKYFTILLNEEKTNVSKQDSLSNNAHMTSPQEIDTDKSCQKEDMMYILGKLLKSKIQAHSEEKTELFTASNIMQNPSLISVMYRLATEDFVRNSTAIFKILECRNATKLVTDWKPSLVDILISLGHQVVLVELKEFPHYTDFAYSILRQLSHSWKNRLPRSFFYPEDVCSVDCSPDLQVVVISPLLPDGDIDLTNQKQDNLTYEILMMLKESCASGLKNHLLKRDLRVGKFSDTEIGVNSIRHIYRSLQRRLSNPGENIQIHSHSGKESFHQFLLSLAGDSLLAAESYIDYCKNPNRHNQDEQADDSTSRHGPLLIKHKDGTGDDNDERTTEIVMHNPFHNEAGDGPDCTTKEQNDNIQEESIFDDIIYSLQKIQSEKYIDDPENYWSQLETALESYTFRS